MPNNPLNENEKPDWSEMLICRLERYIETWTIEVDEPIFFELIKDFLPKDWHLTKIIFGEAGVIFGYCCSTVDINLEPFLVVFEEETTLAFDGYSPHICCIARWDDIPEEYDMFKEPIEQVLITHVVLDKGSLPPVSCIMTQQ